MLDRYQAGLRARASARGCPAAPPGALARPLPGRHRHAITGTRPGLPHPGPWCSWSAPWIDAASGGRPRLLPDLMGDKKGDRGAAIGGSGVPVGAGRQGDGEVGRIYLALCGCF